MDNQNANNNIETLGSIETLDIGSMEPTTPAAPAQPVQPSVVEPQVVATTATAVVQPEVATPVEPVTVQATQPVEPIAEPQATPSFVKPIEEPKKTEDLLNAVPKPDIMVSSPDANNVDIEDLLSDYVGKNYDKISKRLLNLPAFFFAGYYLAYRKMIFEGFVISAIYMSLVFSVSLINPFFSLIAALVLSLIMAVIANKFYISTAKKKIASIRNRNKAKSISDLKRICAKKGGVNIIYPIVISVLVGAIFSLVLTNFFPTYIADMKNDYLNSSKTNENNSGNPQTTDDEKTKSAGQLTYKKTGYIEDQIEVGFLTTFKETADKKDYMYDYEYQTDPSIENSYCKFNVGFVEDYDSKETLISELSNFYKVETVNTIETSIGSWNTFEMTNNSGNKEMFAAITNSNNEVLLFKYTIQSGAKETTCNAYKTAILNTIKFK